MLKKFLITGGTGLLAVNWALEHRYASDFVLTTNEREILLSDVKFKFINLSSREDIRKILENFLPDAVIHTVAITSVEECEKDPISAYAVNTVMAANTAVVCSDLAIPMVHISTDHLFSGQKSLVTEEDKVEPLNVYAKSKADAEIEVLRACKHALIIRTNFFGWGTSYRKSFSDYIINSLRSGRQIKLFDDVFYNPILISSLIKAINDLLNKKESGIFNIVGNDRVSKYEFGRMLANTFNLPEHLIIPSVIKSRPDLIKRPLCMSLSNEKLKKSLGYDVNSLQEDIDLLKKMESNGYAKQIGII